MSSAAKERAAQRAACWAALHDLTDPRHGRVVEMLRLGCTCRRCAALRPGPDDPRHGTQYLYDAYRCRCEPCRAAKGVAKHAEYERNRDRYRRYSQIRWQREREAGGPRRVPPPLAVDDPRHGRPVGYSHHRCRCQTCRVAQSAYAHQRYRERQARLEAIVRPRKGQR